MEVIIKEIKVYLEKQLQNLMIGKKSSGISKINILKY
jgi:hypothetical protein